MPRRELVLPRLAIVALAAVVVTLLLARPSGARPAPQDSPLLPTDTPTALVTPFGTVEIADPTSLPEPERPPVEGFPTVETFPTLEPPTSIPLPAPGAPGATPNGFLPAPTITNPDDIDSLPLARPAVTGGGIPQPFPTPTPARGANPAVAATVAILNVLWLICGGALLIGGAAFIILLARRRSDL